MTDENQGNRPKEPVRVVDRRAFTAEGDRRLTDATHDEPQQAPPPPPVTARPAPAPSGEARGPANDGGHDPVVSAHFQNLVVNLARQAAANLGAARHPLTGQIEVDLEGAQQMIDLLQSLRLKTQGNLTADEADLLEGLIGDLQMQYVAVRSKNPGRP